MRRKDGLEADIQGTVGVGVMAKELGARWKRRANGDQQQVAEQGCESRREGHEHGG